MELRRRDVLKLGLLGPAALYRPSERYARALSDDRLTRLPTPFTRAYAPPPLIDLRASANGGQAQTALELEMRQISVPVLGPGFPTTPLWAYVKGYGTPAPMVDPTIKVDQGIPLALTQINRLPKRHPQLGYESLTSVHLHGSPSLPQFDGYANDTSTTGQKKTYHYDNQESGRTLWYHDHAVHRTDSNAYMGLAAQYHLHDATDSEFGLPTGEFELPITLRDAAFSSDGTLLFDDRSQSSLMGDVLLVNGIPWPYKDVYKRRYRIRLLNASVSRSFLLTLSDPRAKMYVIAGDGGFIPKPVQVSSLRIGMAERYGLILDFTDCADNATVVLRNGELPNNVQFADTDKVMQFKVAAGKAPDLTNNQIPPSFYTARTPVAGRPPGGPEEVMGLQESQATVHRTLEFVRKNGFWTISGFTWDQVIQSGFRQIV